MNTALLFIIVRFLLIGLFGLILLVNIYLVIEDRIKDDNFYTQVMSKLKHRLNYMVLTSYDVTMSTQNNAIVHLGTLMILYGALIIVVMKLFIEFLSIIPIF